MKKQEKIFSLYEQTLLVANSYKTRSWIFLIVMTLVRNFFVLIAMASLWAIVRPEAHGQQISIGILLFIVVLIAGGKFKRSLIDSANFMLALEMRFPHTKLPPRALMNPERQSEAEQEWASLLKIELKRIQVAEFRKIRNQVSSIFLPLVMAVGAYWLAKPDLGIGLNQVASSVFQINQKAELKVLKGELEHVAEKTYQLKTSQILELELTADNMLALQFANPAQTQTPVIQLRAVVEKDGKREFGAVYQSFQMSPLKGESGKSQTLYESTFSINKEVAMFIPSLSDKNPVAIFKLKVLPIPVVTLALETENIKIPWPDEKPLGLKIQVEAKNPLQTVNLLIRSGKKESKELVNNVLGENVLTIDTIYQITLESYVDSDIAEVELVAQAIDKSTPIPLIGYSEPLVIQTASAYGRYQATLNTLKEFKTILDTNLSKQQARFSEESMALMEKAMNQSQDSPFFDGLDRLTLEKFSNLVRQNFTDKQMEELIGFSNEFNDFLLEHESLDDRERDRDFFVASRALSRLLEKDKNQRPVSASVVANRIKDFLTLREARWQKRIERLGSLAPTQWNEIFEKKPFHKAMEQIVTEDGLKKEKNDKKELDILSNAVTNYREWLNVLEQAEDKSREEKQKEREQGLANARDEIRELQKSQGQISGKLDRSLGREVQEMKDNWPVVNMNQNANIDKAKSVEGQLRSMSPEASLRVQAAIEAMKSTSENGNEDRFAEAESNSDLAGRLLRQADSAAQQSQQQNQSRGKRKRVVGDGYFGKNVVGGDVEIKSEYKVDRRYREDILEDVTSFEGEEEDRTILNGYLRDVVR